MSYFEQFDKQHGGDPIQVAPGLRIWGDAAVADGEALGQAIYRDPPTNVHRKLELLIRRHSVLLDRAARRFRDGKQNAMAQGSKLLVPQLTELRDEHDRIFHELEALRAEYANTPEERKRVEMERFRQEAEQQQMQDAAEARVEIGAICLCTEQGQPPLVESED